MASCGMGGPIASCSRLPPRCAKSRSIASDDINHVRTPLVTGILTVGLFFLNRFGERKNFLWQSQIRRAHAVRHGARRCACCDVRDHCSTDKSANRRGHRIAERALLCTSSPLVYKDRNKIGAPQRSTCPLAACIALCIRTDARQLQGAAISSAGPCASL